MSKKPQNDGEMATTALPPAAHFPDITEASGSMLTSQTRSVGDHTTTSQLQITGLSITSGVPAC